jgi:DNA-binding MarR family transcriptional regulator
MKEDDRLIYLLFVAQQSLRTHIQAALLAEGVRVTLGQAGILFLLEKQDGQTMSELCTALGVDNSTLTGLVDRLERSGFVTRKAGQTDRRRFRVHITQEGLEESRRAKPVIRKVNREIKSGFPQDEIETFTHVLRSLLDKFNRSEKTRADFPIGLSGGTSKNAKPLSSKRGK